MSEENTNLQGGYGQMMSELQEVVDVALKSAGGEEIEEPSEEIAQETTPDELIKEDPAESDPVDIQESESDKWAKMYQLDNQLKKEREERKAEAKANTELKERLEKLEEMMNRAKQDPIAFAEELGASPLDWGKRALAEKKDPEQRIAELEARLLEKEKELEQKVEERFKAADQKAIEAQYMAYEKGVQAELSKPEYQLIRDLGAEEQVMNYAAQVAGETGKVLTPAEAAGTVLEGLTEHLKSLKQSEAVAKLLLDSADNQQEPNTPVSKPPVKKKPVVTNQVAPQTPRENPDEPVFTDDLTRHEEIKRFAAMLKWND